MFEINPQLALLITIGTTVGVWLLFMFWEHVLRLARPGENVLKTVAFLASVGLAYFYTPVELPVFQGDPLNYALALLAVATTVFKAAQIFYDFIWKQVGETIEKGFSWAFNFILDKLLGR